MIHTKTRTFPILINIKSVSSAFLSLCLILSLIPADLAFADANQLFITPSSSQMTKGTTFCVDLKSYADTDQSDGTAGGSLTYPTSKLQVKSIMTNGNKCQGSTSSHYGKPSITQQSGKVIFNASRNPAPSGIAQIIAVTFKATGAGTAIVGLSDDSRVNTATTTYNVGSFVITDPTPPAPSSSPSSPSSPSPIPSSTPAPVVSKPNSSDDDDTADTTPTPDPTGLVDNVTVDGSYTSATITWDVNVKNGTSTLNYGVDAVNLDQVAKISKKSQTFNTTIDGLIPGEQYYFTITGKGGSKEGEYSGTIYTRGYPIILNITENDVPAANARVSIGNISRTTDANGKLPLTLGEGDYSGKITTSTATQNINLTVKKKVIPVDGTAPDVQTYPYNLSSSLLEQGPGTGTSILAFVGILAVGLVVLGIGFVGFVSYRRRRFESGDAPSQSNTSSVIVDDGYNWQQQAPPAGTARPVSAPTQAQALPPPPSKPTHNNSVFIDDDEPVDMFDSVDSPRKNQTEEPEQNSDTPTKDETATNTTSNKDSDITISH